jgi:hypothetical protein
VGATVSVEATVCEVVPVSGEGGSVAVWVGSAEEAGAGRLQAAVRRRHPIINIFFMMPLIS